MPGPLRTKVVLSACTVGCPPQGRAVTTKAPSRVAARVTGSCVAVGFVPGVLVGAGVLAEPPPLPGGSVAVTGALVGVRLGTVWLFGSEKAAGVPCQEILASDRHNPISRAITNVRRDMYSLITQAGAGARMSGILVKIRNLTRDVELSLLTSN